MYLYNRLALLFLVIMRCAAINAQPLNVIWQVDRSRYCEVSWIEELIQDIDVVHFEDGNYQTVKDNALIVIAFFEPAYFEKFHALNYKYALIHVGDECYKAHVNNYSRAEFVFRHYWHKAYLPYKNVHAFPLGYMSGFWKDGKRTLKDARQREYTWSFAGQIREKPTRQNMLETLKCIPGHCMHESHEFRDSNALSVTAYRDMLLNTKFVPCTAGYWNMDSFRIYEALECGCIPIVEKQPTDYFGSFLGAHPFIAVDSWAEAPAKINLLLAQPDLLEKLRQACYRWWLDYKDKLKTKLHMLIQTKLFA